jgi:hypothetical protein
MLMISTCEVHATFSMKLLPSFSLFLIDPVPQIRGLTNLEQVLSDNVWDSLLQFIHRGPPPSCRLLPDGFRATATYT